MLGKLNRYVIKVGIFLMTAALIAGMAGCIPFPQNLEIRTWYDLNAIRDNLNDNHILMKDLDSTTAGYEELASPIANGGKGWQPIGTDDGLFTGTFDGQEYEIRDLFIYRPDENGVGLFGAVEQSGVIENVGVTNATVTGEAYVGGLVGINIGTVSNSYSSSNVTSNDELVGGLVGVSEGTVTNSYSTGNVTGNLGVGGLVGANGYRTPGTVSHSYSTGSVNGESSVGGLVGGNSRDSIVSNSYSTGNVTGMRWVGGLVGWSGEDTVSNSYYNYDEVLINGKNIITSGALFGEDFDQWLAEGKFLDVNERLSQESGYYVISNVNDFKQLLAFGQDSSLKFRLKNDLDLTTEPNFYIPRLAGEFDGNGHRILNLSFNFDFISRVGLFGSLTYGAVVTHVGAENANITGDENVGGLVGENHDGAVRNSYATGSVTGDRNVGGLVGYNSGWATVRNSYATSNVTGDENVGGLVGYKSHETTVSHSYSTGNVTGDNDVGGLVGWSGGLVGYSFWDTETSGQATSDGGTGKNTTAMKNITTFSGATWDITAVALNENNPTYIWNIVNNVTYPFLSWQPV